MKAAVPVAAIRQTWKCSGSVTVAQLYHYGTFASVFQTHTHRGAGRHGLAAITPGGSESSDPPQ